MILQARFEFDPKTKIKCTITPLSVPQHQYAVLIDTLVQLNAGADWFSVNKQRWKKGEPSLHR